MTPYPSTPGPRPLPASRSTQQRRDEVAVDLRCSVLVLRDRAVLLLHRAHSPGRPGAPDWVLPGGRPREGEGLGSCARREAAEETGLDVTVRRCLFVLEVAAPPPGGRVVELVFHAESPADAKPRALEADRRPQFVPMDELGSLHLSPPLAGHLRALRPESVTGAAYLGNLWRPDHSAGSAEGWP